MQMPSFACGPGQGLRERKKAATRAALSSAALQLALDHGVDNVTPDAIAAAADVSPRTFHNYFSSKEEAIVAVLADRARELTEALRSRPAGEPVWESLRHVLDTMLDSAVAAADALVQVHRLLKSNASLLADELTAMESLKTQFAEVIAERTGTDVDGDLYPHLQAAAAAVALKSAYELWVGGSTTATLAELVADAFGQLRAGLPEPSPVGTPAGH